MAQFIHSVVPGALALSLALSALFGCTSRTREDPEETPPETHTAQTEVTPALPEMTPAVPGTEPPAAGSPAVTPAPTPEVQYPDSRSARGGRHFLPQRFLATLSSTASASSAAILHLWDYYCATSNGGRLRRPRAQMGRSSTKIYILLASM